MQNAEIFALNIAKVSALVTPGTHFTNMDWI